MRRLKKTRLEKPFTFKKTQKKNIARISHAITLT